MDIHWSHLRRSYYNKKDCLALESIWSNSQYSKLEKNSGSWQDAALPLAVLMLLKYPGTSKSISLHWQFFCTVSTLCVKPKDKIICKTIAKMKITSTSTSVLTTRLLFCIAFSLLCFYLQTGGSSYSTSKTTLSPTFLSRLMISSWRNLVRLIPFTDLM